MDLLNMFARGLTTSQVLPPFFDSSGDVYFWFPQQKFKALPQTRRWRAARKPQVSEVDDAQDFSGRNFGRGKELVITVI